MTFAHLKKKLRSFATRNEIVILTYHGVISNDFPIVLPYQMSDELFRRQIEYLARNYNCVSLASVHRSLESGSNPAGKCVAVTFDDGFANNLYRALPVLEEYGVPATVFVTAGYVDSGKLLWPELAALLLAVSDRPSIEIRGQKFALNSADCRAEAYRALTKSFKGLSSVQIESTLQKLLSTHNVNEEILYELPFYDDFRLLLWPELERLHAHELITIGSHTVGHRRLSAITTAQAKAELSDSRQILEDRLGKIEFFAYPFGGFGADYDQRHVEMAARCGYLAAFAIDDGRGASRRSDTFIVPRTNITSSFDVEGLDYLVSGGGSLSHDDSAASFIRGLSSGIAN